MHVDCETGDVLATIVLIALLMIVTFGLSYFIPNIAKEMINRFRKK